MVLTCSKVESLSILCRDGSKESSQALVSGGLITPRDTGQSVDKHLIFLAYEVRRSNEFIRALKGIWTEDNFNFSGDFYQVSET